MGASIKIQSHPTEVWYYKILEYFQKAVNSKPEMAIKYAVPFFFGTGQEGTITKKLWQMLNALSLSLSQKVALSKRGLSDRFRAVFGSFSDRIRPVLDRFRTVLHDFHIIFSVFSASSSSRGRFRRSSPSPSPSTSSSSSSPTSSSAVFVEIAIGSRD